MKKTPKILLTRKILWGFKCEENRCVKFKLTPENNDTALGLTSCRLFCNQNEIGTLWPKPSGDVKVFREVTQINPKKITFKTENFKKEPEHWEIARNRFVKMQEKKIPKKFPLESGGGDMVVEVSVDSDEMGKKVEKNWKKKFDKNNYQMKLKASIYI